MCVQAQLACWRRACPSCRGGLFLFDRGFSFARERVVFSAVFFAMCVQTRFVCWRRACPSGRGGLFLFDGSFSFSKERDVFLRSFSRCACRRSLPAGAGLAPRAGAGFFYLTEVFRSRESEMFFCGIFRDVRADAACLLARACSSCRGGFFYLTEVFCSRESELFFFAGFFAMCVQAQLACWRGLAPQAGAGPSFLDEKKGSKDSPRGEFRFSPLGTPSQRPKALPLETGRSSRSGSYSRTGTACA